MTTMESINIAIIGAEGVGKSTFIQRSLRLLIPPKSHVASVRLEVEGIAHIVTLYELGFIDRSSIGPSQRIHWPKQIDGKLVPRMDGVLVLYDVTSKESTRELSQTMAAVANSTLPTILVATKYDVSESQRQVDPAELAAKFPTAITNFQTSDNTPRSQRDCLQAILEAALAHRRGRMSKSEAAATRFRAASTANLALHKDQQIPRRNSDQVSKHSRSSSDQPLPRSLKPPTTEKGSLYSRSPSRSPHDMPPPRTSTARTAPNESGTGIHPSASSHSLTLRPLEAQDSFLHLEESDAETHAPSHSPSQHSLENPSSILPLQDEDRQPDRSFAPTGVTFDELVDRLLASKRTRNDNNFSDVFLCLFRQFAPPRQLFEAIFVRWNSLNENHSVHFLLKSEAQLRIIDVIAKWVSLYPGDFARQPTRRLLEELMESLSNDPIHNSSLHLLRAHLETRVVEDDDTWWAFADDPPDAPETEPGTPPGSCGGSNEAAKRLGELPLSMGLIQLESGSSASVDLRRPSVGSGETSPCDREAKTSMIFQFYSHEDYKREAASLVPYCTLSMSKLRYHVFMDIEVDDVAEEMTRMDWIMFSSIRMRDLIRHVSLRSNEKERCRSLKNVNRWIAHFNHLAKWVENMILIRDKAKHRGPCLEKLMIIAQKLRQLNNYHGLAAVLAGINSTAIHRLAQTRVLVSPEVQKRFARLGLLMGTQKGHFAYRLAWENSPLPRIPFMPLHQRDLVSAGEGSQTFVGPNGDRINWKKFEVLGEVLLPLMRSQGHPYPRLVKHGLSRELILGCRIMQDEEEIYQRSVQCEPNPNVNDSGKKKFSWLTK